MSLSLVFLHCIFPPMQSCCLQSLSSTLSETWQDPGGWLEPSPQTCLDVQKTEVAFLIPGTEDRNPKLSTSSGLFVTWCVKLSYMPAVLRLSVSGSRICVLIPIRYGTKEALEWKIHGRIKTLITQRQSWFKAIVPVKVFVVPLSRKILESKSSEIFLLEFITY